MSNFNPVLLKSHLKTLRLPAIVREYAKAAREAGERVKSREPYLECLAEAQTRQRR